MVDEPALTSLDRLKHLFPGFAANNPSHRAWAVEFLNGLQEALFSGSADVGLKPERKVVVWFDQEPFPFGLETTNHLRTPDDSQDRLLLYPSDVVQLIVELANRLKVPCKTSNYYFTNAIDDDEINERKVLDVQTTGELGKLAGEIRLRLDLLDKSATDKAEDLAEEKDTAEEEAKKPPEASKGTVATAKVGPVPEGGGEGADTEATPTTPPDEIPPTSPFHNESFITAVRNRNENREFAWIYNHTLFDLLGRHGITTTDIPFLTRIDVEVRTYLKSLSPQQLADLFANPIGRMAVVTIIYQRLSAQPDFVGKLREQFERHIETLPETERQTFIAVTGFDSANTIEKQLAQQLAQKPDFATQNPITEIQQSLAQLIGTKKIDGTVAINFEQSAQALVSLASSEADLFRLIDQLTPEAIAITFFPNPNNPNVPDPSMLVQIKQNLTLIRSLLKNSLGIILVDKIANKPPGLNQEPGVAIALTGDSVDNITTSDATVTAIRTLASAMPSGSSRNATEEALTNDESVSHTQVLMDQYQTRIQKIWLQLDENTQLQAYLRLYNMTDSPENKTVLLDKVKHLRDAETGSLPWNPSMFGLINWESFLRKAKKSELLYQHELDEAEKKALVAQKAHLKATNDARELAATGFTTGLSSQQIIQLQYSTLLNQLEEAVVYARGVAERLKNPTTVGELEYRSALAVLERVNVRIQLLRQQDSSGVSEEFSTNLKQQIDTLATTQHSVLQLILAQWPGNELIESKQRNLDPSSEKGDQQTKQQEYITLLSHLDRAVDNTEPVSSKLEKNQLVSSIEFRTALAVLEHVDAQIAQLIQVGPPEISDAFAGPFKQELERLTAKRQQAHQTIIGGWSRLMNVVEGSVNKDVQAVVQEATLSSQLTLVETYEVMVTYQAPTLLLPTAILIEQPGFSPDAPLEDTIDQHTLLPEPNTASLASLNRGAKRNNSLTPNRLEQINAASQNNQSFNDLKNVASGVGEVAAQSKGNWVLAAGLGIKKFFTDKEFRQSVIRTGKRYSKKVALLGGILIGGGVLVGVLLRNLLGLVGKFGGLVAGAAAGGAIGMAFGGPLGALIGAGIGGYLGYSAAAKAVALNAAAGAELIPPGATSPGFGGAFSSPTSPTTVGSATSGGFGSNTFSANPTGTASTSTSGITGTATPASQSAFQNSVSPSSFSGNTATNGVTQPGTQFGGQSTLGSTAGPISSLGDAGAAIPTTATITASAPFLGTALGIPLLALIPGVSMLGLAMITVYTMFVIFSAFLIPLPVGNLSGTNSTKSEYAVLTKLASPTSLQNNSTANVIFKVILQPRRNYRLKVTAITDTANTGFSFQTNRTDFSNPQVAPPASLLNPRIALSDFSTVFEGQTQTKEYTVTFSGGKNVLINNVVTITFDVMDDQGNTVATGKTMEAAASVSIGDHGVQCWPATGEINQLPGDGFSHGNADAFDIAAPTGNNVYTPFAGWVQKGDMFGEDYGKFVVVDSYVQGQWIRIVYGHLQSAIAGTTVVNFWDNLTINHDNFGSDHGESNNVGQYVGAGQLIGHVDSTGHSTGPHLHYELAYINEVRHRLGGGLTLTGLVPRRSGGGSYRIGDDVTTCFPIH